MLKWGKNVYDIDIVEESGLEFKKRVEKLTRKSVFCCEEQNCICKFFMYCNSYGYRNKKGTKSLPLQGR